MLIHFVKRCSLGQYKVLTVVIFSFNSQDNPFYRRRNGLREKSDLLWSRICTHISLTPGGGGTSIFAQSLYRASVGT